MKLITVNNSFRYETENLLRLFFPHIKITENDDEVDFCKTVIEGETISAEVKIGDIYAEKSEKTDLKRKYFEESDESFFERKIALLLFEILKEETDYTPPWGILTGVRPAKLMTKLSESYGEEKAKAYFVDELKVSEEKADLALSVAKTESLIIAGSKPSSFSLYIAIPFCPSRCSYCSFVSHSNDSAKKLIPSYVEKICEELKYTAEIANSLELTLQSVYMGGGTPTVLTAEQMKKITDTISESFDLSSSLEYTIEAGRPDSITEEKLRVIKNSGSTRISINPQTFSNEVLKVIGRNHTGEDTLKSMALARKLGFDNINTDLIAGLPSDTFEGFSETLEKAISLSPENITVHTLALKRSSTLVTGKGETNSGALASKMLSHCQRRLSEEGYIPYYMYRQSKCLGNLENVGWAKKGYEGLYNVYMMEECQTVLAVGAGAVTKLKAPHGSEIERIFNYKYPYEYINNFDEILNRKNYIKEFYSKYIP